jgi:hypothetical protein
MKPHRTGTGDYALLIALTTLVTLILLSSPLVRSAGAAETLSTTDLLTQAGDMELSASTAQPGTETAMTSDSNGFDAEQLEQLVAPIALYPDALLMQILMASTYPLEIVEADRWIRDQPDLTGDALEKALLEKDWDPSVESLTTLPSVLKQLSENLDWTQDLGDAFLAQQDDLLDTVQRMRGLAYEAGNLETTEQQSVTQQEDRIIVIESSSPEVIYVPTYSPTVVYGPAWGYPYWYYPRWYYPPAPGYGFVAFGAGIVVGAAIWGGCRWGWGHNSVNININRHNEFNRNTNVNFDRNRNSQGGRGSGGTAAWQHDSSHRKGVNYNSSKVAQNYGASSGSNRVTSNQARGRSAATVSNRAATGAQAGNRSAVASRPSPSPANRNASSNSAARSPSTANRGTGGNSAFSGSRSPSTDRMSSSRGAASRGATSYGGSRGGASRGGGRRR